MNEKIIFSKTTDDKPKDFYKKLPEFRIFLVKVKTTKYNIPFNAVLVTGFNSGSYTYIYTQDSIYNVHDCYYVEIIKDLGNLRE